MIWQNFQQGLVVTGVGMGLVFLTLLVVMALIWALDRVFKAQPEKLAPAVAPVAVAAPAAPAPVDEGADMAAAIAVVIALQGIVGVQAEPEYEDIDGETVTVTSIDPGLGTWKAYGRAQAVK